MVASKAEKNIVEIFRIQTEGFDLWAALISLKKEGFIIYGGTRFKKGEVLGFHSEIGDRDSLRDRLLTACQPIAAFYGARVIHRKIERPERERGALPRLEEAGEWLH